MVKVKEYYNVEIGDKFCMGHGQKATCGNIYKDENMPYFENGIIPDKIFNPHSLLTRKTVASMLEG